MCVYVIAKHLYFFLHDKRRAYKDPPVPVFGIMRRIRFGTFECYNRPPVVGLVATASAETTYHISSSRDTVNLCTNVMDSLESGGWEFLSLRGNPSLQRFGSDTERARAVTGGADRGGVGTVLEHQPQVANR